MNAIAINFQFWLGQDWPTPAWGHVFLAEAVHDVGRALYPHLWNGVEPLNAELPPPPSFISRVEGKRRNHRAALKAEVEAERFAAVKAHIVFEAAAGRLITATRAIGRELLPFPASEWIEDRTEALFQFCRIDLPSGTAAHIFVSERSLAALVAELAAKRRARTVQREAEPAQEATSKPRRGRPSGWSNYDWPTFYEAALVKLKNEGGIIQGSASSFRKADLARDMAKWCSHKWGVEPSWSLLRHHCDIAVARFNSAK